MSEFQHLHVHSDFSISSGMIKLEDLVSESKKRGLSCVALTDYSNLMGMYDLYNLCKSEGLKPLYGCEFYVVPDKTKRDLNESLQHTIFFAKNQEGLRNLITLNTIASMYSNKKPRIDKSVISANCKGLIALTGSLNGCVPQSVLKDTFESEIQYWEDNFGDDLYLEIQSLDSEDQKKVNQAFIGIAPNRVIPTNNVHYLKKEDEKWHKLLLMAQVKVNVRDINAKVDIFEYGKSELYLKNLDEMCESFEKNHTINIEKYLPNIQSFCDKIEKFDLDNKIKIPVYRREIHASGS